MSCAHPTDRLNARWPWAALMLAGLLLTSALGCEKDAQTLTLEGTSALSQKNYDGAIVSYTKALALEASNFDATVGLAEAYTKKGDITKAKEYFAKAKALKVGGAKEKYMEQLMQDLYMEEAKAIEDKTSEAYHDALWKVVDVRDRGGAASQAYTLLGEYYMERGDTFAKDKDQREKAVEMYEAFKKIRTQRTLRTQALQKAVKLQREIYDDKFAANFAKIKPGLVKDGLFDESTRRVQIKVLIEDKEINPKTDEDKATLKQKLANQAFFDLVKMTYMLTGDPVPADSELKRLAFQTVKEVEGSEILEKGKAQLIIDVGLDELREVSYKRIAEPNRKAAGNKDAAAPEEEGDDAPEEEAAPPDPTNAADAGAAPAPSAADAN